MQNCQMCIQKKRINIDLLRTELPDFLEWDLGREDVLQMDILPNLPPNGGFDNIIAAIDVCLFPILICIPNNLSLSQRLEESLWTHCANKHIYTTRIMTDMGTQNNSQITRVVAAVLGVQLKHYSTKHAQT